MTRQQQQFCINFVHTRDVKQSALEAGYAKSFSESKAYLLPKQHQEHILKLETEYYKQQFKVLAVDAVKALKEIINNSENDSARLSASKYVLELAGVADITSKSLGSSTPINMVRATVDGLMQLKRVEEVAKLRNKSIEEILG